MTAMSVEIMTNRRALYSPAREETVRVLMVLYYFVLNNIKLFQETGDEFSLL